MVDWTTIAIVLPTLVVAYIIFGIAGFGTALVAAPVLAHTMPIASVVPLLALLDFGAAALNGFKLSDKIAKAELVWLAPLMIAGSIVGVTLLISLPATLMMFLLGVFAAGYGIHSLFAPPPERKIGKEWVGVFGPLGGIFSAMFGSGGFVYAIYLSRRLDDKDAIRATQSTLIGMSTLTRVLLFLGVGIYSDFSLLLLAVASIPAMGIGIYAAQWFTARLSREQFLRIVYVLLIGTGNDADRPRDRQRDVVTSRPIRRLPFAPARRGILDSFRASAYLPASSWHSPAQSASRSPDRAYRSTT